LGLGRSFAFVFVFLLVWLCWSASFVIGLASWVDGWYQGWRESFKEGDLFHSSLFVCSVLLGFPLFSLVALSL